MSLVVVAGLLAGGGVAATAAADVASAAAAGTAAVATQPYTWKNAEIVGGGFVPSVVFNRGAKDVAYARTDIGGAYRWDPSTKRWTPMLDSVGWTNWGDTGVLSLAADPVDTQKVYAAVGNYTNSWDPNNGSILRSSDRGKTWAKTQLPFKIGGNMPGRGMGERLMVDPNKNSVLYFGASGGNGLWRSTDSGVTWAKVTSLTNTGSYADNPSDTTGYQSDPQGIVWVTFDPRSSSSGTATKTIYVGVADKDHPVYRSTDSGATWSPVAGTPTGFIAHKGVLDESTGNFFITTSTTAGPYDGAHGDIWRLATATGTWTQVSPVPSSNSSDNYFGYSGLTVDRQKPGTLMATAYSSWWPDTQIFRSTDSGATWTRAWEFTSYPDRSLRYKLDASAAPWLTFGANPTPPEVTPKLGWMTEGMEIDPFNSDRMFYGTGATLYGTDNLTAWDSGGKIDIGVRAQGIEETAVQDLISPPTGAPLLSALGDVGGFRHTDLTKVPSLMFTQPTYTSSTSIDYAETNPSIIVRAGEIDKTANPNVNRVAFSTDDGQNWFQANSEPGGVTGGGTVAAAADGSRFVWAPAGAAPVYSVGFGNSWTSAKGLPTGAQVESDRVNSSVFYGYADGKFYVSKDGGATFTASSATGLPASSVRFKAVPGRTGDVWLAGGVTAGPYGLWHSTDSGATFTKVSGIDEADTIGFGKAAPGASYQALYSSAKIGGVRGIFRSDDAGATWVRINDDAHQWGWTGSAITGDPRVYGRVYVGTNGRGVIYGDIGGTTTPTTTTAVPTTTTAVPTTTTAVPTTTTAVPTTTMVTTRPPTTTTVSPTASNNRCTATFKLDGSWPGGFQGTVTVSAGSSAISSWRTTFTLPSGTTISQSWGGTVTTSGSSATVTNTTWNGSLAPGAATTYGFLGSGTAPSSSLPVACSAS
jgi:xyloglucan-specific exo-beta-1,4-glucanase